MDKEQEIIKAAQAELEKKRAGIKQNQGNTLVSVKNLIAPDEKEKPKEQEKKHTSPCKDCGVDVEMRYQHWNGDWVSRDFCESCNEKREIERRNKHAQENADEALKNINTHLKNMGVSPRFVDAEIKDFPKSHQGLVHSEKGLFLTGPRGTGKTHLATAIMRETFIDGVKKRLEYNKTAPIGQSATSFPSSMKFISVPELLMKIRQAFGEHARYTEKEIIEDYAEVGLLFLDDLGAEKTTEWSMQTLYLIIDRRYREMKRTIITSNLSLEEIASTVGDRIASRITEMCDIKVIKGEDRRLRR